MSVDIAKTYAYLNFYLNIMKIQDNIKINKEVIIVEIK